MTRKLLLILLLLCFQTQTLAALAAACAHDGGNAVAVAASCHQPAATAGQGGSDTPDAPGFDCCHCQLGCAFGISILPLDRSFVAIPENSSISGRLAVQHFYRFVPDPLQRPPISARS